MIELAMDDLAAIRNALGERYPIDERDQAMIAVIEAAKAMRFTTTSRLNAEVNYDTARAEHEALP